MCVVVKGYSAALYGMNSNVPQVTILSANLLLLRINDLLIPSNIVYAEAVRWCRIVLDICLH